MPIGTDTFRAYVARRKSQRQTLKSLENTSEAAREDEAPLRLADVLREELHALHPDASDRPRPGAGEADLSEVVERIHEKRHAALCLSGGGIRSATFNLGVIQGLARAGVLDRFQYLSTVSGGGYIGSWLSSWIVREQDRATTDRLPDTALGRVAESLRSGRDVGAPDLPDKTDSEAAPIRHLRAYTRYLSPRFGLFSADTWTLFAAYLRNLLLTWLVLVPAIAGIVGIPLVASSVVRTVASGQASPKWLLPALIIVGLVLAIAAVRFVHRHRPDARLDAETRRAIQNQSRRAGQREFLAFCLAPLLLSGAALTTAWVWITSLGVDEIDTAHHAVYGTLNRILPAVLSAQFPPWAQDISMSAVPPAMWLWAFILPMAGVGALVHFAGWLLSGRAGRADSVPGRIGEGILIVVFGGLCSWIIGLAAWHAVPWPNPWSAIAAGAPRFVPSAVFATFALPVYCALLVLAGDLHLGFVSSRPLRADDSEREWAARFNGWVLAMVAAWLVLSGLAQLLPDVVEASRQWLTWSSLTSLVAGSLTASIGRSATTASSAEWSAKGRRSLVQSVPRRAILVFATAVFCVAFVLLMTWLNAAVAFVGACKLFAMPLCAAQQGRPFLDVLDEAPVSLMAGVVASLLLLSLAAGFAVDMNKFSLHGLYRMRLIRAYLGASRTAEARKPDPFIGFDPSDNVNMRDILPATDRSDGGPPPAPRLFHVVNMALNVVHRAPLAWQDRKAESFTVSPLHAGNFRLKYRRTSPTRAQADLEFQLHMAAALGMSASDRARAAPRYYGGGEGISLGTAMAISGAAASPNMGYHSSALVTFIMTLFNARLGWWLGNPGEAGDRVFDYSAPRSSLFTMWEELFGLTDDKSPFVYLSDGGHFDNLGLYEMVLRRNRFIVVSDASGDPTCNLADLGNAIRQIRADFQVPIVFSPTHFSIRSRSADGTRVEGSYWAVGRVRYSAVDAGPDMPPDVAAAKYDGVLLYLKPCFYGQEPRDVFNYALQSPTFPHEPTSDQFFSEAQFESYRALGEFVVETAWSSLELDDMFGGAYPVALGPNGRDQAPFARDVGAAGGAVDRGGGAGRAAGQPAQAAK